MGMKLAVLFPGIGYHCDKPLLYYGRDIAYELGYEECIKVNYTGFSKDIKGNAAKMEEAFYQALAQAEEILQDVEWEQYEEVLFISKSIGTIVAAAYAKKHQVRCKNIYYTPLAHTFLFEPKNGMAFTGTKDNWVDYHIVVEKCREIGMPVHVVPQANHSLETEDTLSNLEDLKEIMERTKEFLEE